MKRRTVLAVSIGVVGSLAGCLSTLSTPSVSESTIEACEVSYLEAEQFEGEEPPSIDVTVTSAEAHDSEYARVDVESHWVVSSVSVSEITVEPVDTDPADDAPSSTDGPFADLEAFHETLTDVIESGEQAVIDAGHEEYPEVRDAFVDVFDITDAAGSERKEDTLEHEGHALEVSMLVEDLHGDGEARATYFVSESDTYRVEDGDEGPADGTLMEC